MLGAKKSRSQSILAITLVIQMLLFAMLACGGGGTGSSLPDANVNEENVRILDLPQFVCPTSTPVPTNTQIPTAIQPTLNVPPVGYQTNTPVPGFMPVYAYYCPPMVIACGYYTINLTNTPVPGGNYATPGYDLPGATSTPRPTHTPWPSPTPYTVVYNYHMGADIYTGGFVSPLKLRLQVANPQVQQIGGQQIVSWQVEIENLGDVDYYALPASQTFVAEINDGSQIIAGWWPASIEAMEAINMSIAGVEADIVMIGAGQTFSFSLAANTSNGSLHSIGWILDPYGGEGGGMYGGNVAYWINNLDPHGCSGNVSDGAIVPTLSGPMPTHTPTPTTIPCTNPFGC